MRLDHLLSMETGTECHDSVIRVDEVGTQKAGYGSFVVQFSGTGMVFEKERARGMGV